MPHASSETSNLHDDLTCVFQVIHGMCPNDFNVVKIRVDR